MLSPETVLVAALVGCVVLPWLAQFIAAPVRMHARSRQAIDPVYTPDDEHRLPPAARRAAAELRALGFAREWQAVAGYDAGLEQQVFRLLASAEHIPVGYDPLPEVAAAVERDAAAPPPV